MYGLIYVKEKMLYYIWVNEYDTWLVWCVYCDSRSGIYVLYKYDIMRLYWNCEWYDGFCGEFGYVENV